MVGLLDFVSHQTISTAAHENQKDHQIPGLGFGANPELVRLYFRNLRCEDQVACNNKVNRVGPPIKLDTLKISNMRVFYCWYFLRSWSLSDRKKITNKRLIDLLTDLSRTSKQLDILQLHNADIRSLQRSISEGRRFWKIDPNWDSEKCFYFLCRLCGATVER